MRIWLLVSILLQFKMSLIAMPNISVCANELVTLDDFIKNNAKETPFSWRNSNISIGLEAIGAGIIPHFIAVNATTENVVSLINYTTINQNGSAETLDFTLTVRPKPIVMLNTLSATLCNGTTFSQTLTSMPKGATFTFTNDNPDIGVFAITNSKGLKFSPTNANREKKIANISIMPVLNGCIGAPQFVEMTVLPTPSVSPISDTAVCSGNIISTIFSGNLPETAFSWTNDNPSVGLPSTGSGNLNFRTGANLTGENQVANIIVTPRLNGCEGLSKSFKIIVKPAPILETTVFNFCVNDSGHIDFKTNFKATTVTTFGWISNNINTGVPPNGTENALHFLASDWHLF